jgi:hypothetical protein
MSEAPQVHDYTAPTRGYGHDYILTPDPDPSTAKVTGWGCGLRVGDYLMLSRSTSSDETALYRLTEVVYKMDPEDMWNARAVFVPGSSEEGRLVAEGQRIGREVAESFFGARAPDPLPRAEDWQGLAALFLAKLGGKVTITGADQMEILDRRPTFVRWPMRITGMEYDVELFDGDGQPWAVRDV